MRKLYALLFLAMICFAAFAQDEETKKEDKPVRQPFESAYLIDNQTTYIPYVNTFEYVIQHKFGTIENGASDLFGLYAPGANVRLGFNYVIYKNVQIGYGLTKNNFTHEFNAKWTVFEQTRENTKPFALALYGVTGLNGQDESVFGADYSFNGRFSYFAQAIISRKFNDKLSLQFATSFAHFNMVDREKTNFDAIGLHLNGRMKVSPMGAIIFNYDQPLTIDPMVLTENKDKNISPNIAFGYEISTSTHAFQVYAGQYSGILPQDIMVKNYNKFDANNFAIGFTITRLWSF